MGDVVVLLPGILGSVLQRDGKDVWAISKGAALRGVLSLGKSVKSLALSDDDPGKADLGDGVTAPRLMPDVHLIPGLWKIDGYTRIKQVLFDRFDLTDGENWFDFPYDWRRDNRVAANHLAEQAPRWLAAWKAKSGNADAKLVLLAHSMGGLVARHYLEGLDGWKDTRHLITFGTPYRGSVNSIDFLVNGFKKGFGPFGLDLSGLLRSLTSVYQLAPIYPCIDVGNGALVRMAESDLPGVDRSKAESALQFHRDIEASVAKHQDDESYRRGGYRIHPVVGAFQPTRQSGMLKGRRFETLESLDGEDYGGDGTVPRVSATPIELSDDPREVYAAEQHASLQNVDAVLTNVAGALTRKSLAGVRDTPFDGFSLRVDDLYLPDEPVVVHASTLGVADRAIVSLQDVDSEEVVRRHTVKLGRDATFRAELPPVAAGVYRVRVEAADPALGMKPVRDLITVAGPDETADSGD